MEPRPTHAGTWLLRANAAVFLVLGLVPVANLLTGGGAVTWWFAASREWALLGGLVLLASWLIARRGGEPLATALERVWARVLRIPERTFLTAAVLSTLAVTAAISAYCFARQPLSADELALLWSAKMLASGQLALPVQPHREFFSTFNVVDFHRWYSHYPVGAFAALALGVRAGAAWLVNPLLAAFTVRNVYRFAQREWSESAARAGTLLMLLTPFFLFMGASFQNHIPAVAMMTLALAALARWTLDERPRARWLSAVVIGLAVGALATIRPLDAILVGVVVAGSQLTTLVRAPQRAAEIAAEALAFALPVALLMLGNARTTGHPLLMAYDELWGPQRLGFGPAPFGPPHTPRRALAMASANLMRLDVYLFEWPLPALVPVIASLVAMRRAARWDVVLVALIDVFIVAYALYWADGFWLGPRYLFTVLPAFVLLAARAPALVGERVTGTLRTAVQLVLPLCVLVSLAGIGHEIGVTIRARQYHAALGRLKVDVGEAMRRAGVHHALVFVHEGWESRLVARLWNVGLSHRDTERLVLTSDACTLETTLDAEERAPTADSSARVARFEAVTPDSLRVQLRPRPDLTGGDEALRFADGAPLDERCRAELAADTRGVSLFAPYLLLETIQPDGSLGGDVVYARDFGARDERLREQYGDRAWYRLRPRAPDDPRPMLERY